MWRSRQRNYVWTPDRSIRFYEERLRGDPEELAEIRRELAVERKR
jgi:hypothetical protein